MKHKHFNGLFAIAIILPFLLSVKVAERKQLIGRINGGKPELVIDTVAFKARILSHFYPAESTLHLDKISIQTGKSLGEVPMYYYYLQLRNFNRHLKISRYLYQEGDRLYFIDDQNYDWRMMWCGCEGMIDCEPNLYRLPQTDTYKWICGETYGCRSDTLCIGMKGFID